MAKTIASTGSVVILLMLVWWTAYGKARVLSSAERAVFTYTNPLPFEYEALGEVRRELRDPCIIREGDTYYLVFTVWPFSNREEKRLSLPNQGGSPGIMLFSSKNLKSWIFENWLVKAGRIAGGLSM